MNVEMLPNWEFDVEEVSYGVYKVRALHTLGPSVEKTGTDYKKLVAEVAVAAQEMEAGVTRKIPERQE